jgi:hypothetical protein
MKIQLAQVPTKEQIKAALEQHLPQYAYAFRIGKFVDCKQTFFVGATVVPKKDGIVINSNFPSPGANMFFTLFMLATGILIGLILWLVVWKGSQDKVRDAVGAVLKHVFAGGPQPQLAGGPPQQMQPHMQQPHMQQPNMQQPNMQQPQQGFAPGMQVFVAPGDGQRYPATVVSAANGQYQCMMPNGQPYWFPAQNVSVS